jgi:hypothetical protein
MEAAVMLTSSRLETSLLLLLLELDVAAAAVTVFLRLPFTPTGFDEEQNGCRLPLAQAFCGALIIFFCVVCGGAGCCGPGGDE